MSTRDLLIEIERQRQVILQSPALRAFLENEKLKADSVLCVNNSFIFREVATSKNQRVLASPIASLDPIAFGDGMLVTHRFYNDYKVVASKDPGLKPAELKAAVEGELKRVGEIIFVLLGQAEERVIHSEPIGHSLFNSLTLHTSLEERLSLQDKTIIINDASDEDGIWAELAKVCKKAGAITDEFPDGFDKAFAQAFANLSDNARVSLVLPKAGSIPKKGILNQIASRIRENARDHDEAVKASGGKKSGNPGAYNEMLRIAYNFASEALQLLGLIIEICDLKPLCLWLTLSDQWALSESFRRLPWTRPGKKASLKEYQRIINGARNSAFHHFLPFNRTVDVKVDGMSIALKKLTLFSDHSKKQNALEYDDQPIFEALMKFTRSEEKLVSAGFWKQNANVMLATAGLVEAFERALRLIHGAAHS